MKPKIVLAREEALPNYVEALEQSGAAVLCTLDSGAVQEAQGLLLPGGGDMDPVYYGEKRNGSMEPEVFLDEGQWELLKAFVQAKKPVLGICRGLQMINVFFGGSLYQDLAERDAHVQKDRKDQVHPVKAVPQRGGIFSELYGEEFMVNSAHHQGVKEAGEGLRLCLLSRDGVVEALVHESLPIWGVQFHPERMGFSHKNPQTVDGARIFGAFMKLCRQ